MNKNGGWVKVEFCHAIVTAWECPHDLREHVWIAGPSAPIPKGYTLAQFAEDGPYRIMKLALN